MNVFQSLNWKKESSREKLILKLSDVTHAALTLSEITRLTWAFRQIWTLRNIPGSVSRRLNAHVTAFNLCVTLSVCLSHFQNGKCTRAWETRMTHYFPGKSQYGGVWIFCWAQRKTSIEQQGNRKNKERPQKQPKALKDSFFLIKPLSLCNLFI